MDLKNEGGNVQDRLHVRETVQAHQRLDMTVAPADTGEHSAIGWNVAPLPFGMQYPA